MDTFRIQPAKESDREAVLSLYSAARIFMRNHGNPTQWAVGAPNSESFTKDLKNEASYVVVESGEIIGTFALYHRDENYLNIHGNWINNEPYAAIHRIASVRKGVGTFILQAICGQYKNVRIDTHKDNIPMQNLLKKMGFVHCGTILLLNKDNSPREAYMKVNSL